MSSLINLIIIILILPSLNESLSTSSKNLPKVKKVAIIGTGIAGLSTAHALLSGSDLRNNDQIEVHLYESRPTFDYKAGAGIQINGGMTVLNEINSDLFNKVKEAALPLTMIRSRTNPWFKNDASENLFSTLLELNLDKVIRSSDIKELVVNDDIMAYTITRGALQEVLLGELPQDVKRRIQFDSKLVDIFDSSSSKANGNSNSSEEGIMCKFSNGSVEGPFDIIIGCDGIKSAVKEFVETSKISSAASDQAIYSGLRIKVAVQDGAEGMSDSMPNTSELRQYFGNGAYSLHGIYGAGKNKPPTQAAFLIYQDENYIGPFPKSKDQQQQQRLTSNKVNSENVDWAEDTDINDKIKSDFLQRIRNSQVPKVEELISVIENAQKFFEIGVYFHNPLRFQGWSKRIKDKHCVLVGDAAHAMPPFLGQGANQAIQDAYCLSQAINTYNKQFSPSSSEDEVDIQNLQYFLKNYEKIRWKPTADITLKAAFLGYLETGNGDFLSKFRDAFFFTMGKIGVAKKVYLDGATPKV